MKEDPWTRFIRFQKAAIEGFLRATEGSEGHGIKCPCPGCDFVRSMKALVEEDEYKRSG